ncbi:MAG: S26 family signal peptidase [Pseudomonadota bacterium]
MKLKLLTALGATALCGATAWEMIVPPTPRLIYNESPSALIGWYRIDPDGASKRDVMVAAFAPALARNLADERGYLPHSVPLLKTVWATGGEKVCRFGVKVEAPNRPVLTAHREDGLGRDLPRWDGCITLSETEVFLISTDVQTSFDSRYFGPVPLRNVLGTAEFLGPETDELDDAFADVVGPRGQRQ